MDAASGAPPGLRETAAALRAGRWKLGEYLDSLCDRIEALDPEIQAMVPEPDRRGRLRREAAALAARYPEPAARPPLYGVPVGVKDIFRVDGFSTRAGSRLPPELFAGPEAPCVTQLREAGALVLGKTATTEFAYFAPGPTRNPRRTTHTPGGSSSGSAAAVAAGFCPLALGSQTSGSVIRPAAFCGVAGFKPTFGRVPVDGVLPLAPALDHVGWFAPTAAGLALAAALLCRDWRPAPDPWAAGPPVLGVPEGPYLEQASAPALAAFEQQLEQLAAAGCEVRRVPALGDVAALRREHNRLVAAEAARVHAAWFARYGELYHPRTAALVREGRTVSAPELATARLGQAALRHELTTALREHGLHAWVCPAAPGPAPEGLESTGDPAMNFPWSHAGLPTVTLPAGEIDGLPLGLQLAAPAGEDERLLALAAGLQSGGQ